jgi:hypothetical protein
MEHHNFIQKDMEAERKRYALAWARELLKQRREQQKREAFDAMVKAYIELMSRPNPRLFCEGEDY